ncbi:MAG: hypothetical protein ACP5LO_09695, partial [Calditerrivibrio sp.]
LKDPRIQKIAIANWEHAPFIFYLVIGSVLGSLSGSLFLNLFSSHSLRLILGIILLISSLKMLYINKKGGLILLKELF